MQIFSRDAPRIVFALFARSSVIFSLPNEWESENDFKTTKKYFWKLRESLKKHEVGATTDSHIPYAALTSFHFKTISFSLVPGGDKFLTCQWSLAPADRRWTLIWAYARCCALCGSPPDNWWELRFTTLGSSARSLKLGGLLQDSILSQAETQESGV